MIGQMDVALYNRARSRGWRGQVWSALTGRSRRLLPLAEIDAACIVCACHCARIRMVPISHIRGSQGRSKDFDRDFNPLQEHTKDRWLNVAVARQWGKSLPPVELIQVGDVYFVRDGHHRISVARALGQQDIEAEVTVWQVNGPLPWEKPTTVSGVAGQEVGMEQNYEWVKDGSARLQERFQLSLSNLLAAVWMKLKAQVVSPAGAGA
jgi:hypothetical protein